MKVNGADINTVPSFVYQAAHSQKVNLGLVGLSLLLAGGAVSMYFLRLKQSLVFAAAGTSVGLGLVGIGNAFRVHHKVLVLTECLATGDLRPKIWDWQILSLLQNYPWVNKFQVVITEQDINARMDPIHYLTLEEDIVLKERFNKNEKLSTDTQGIKLDRIFSGGPIVYVYERK